MSCKKRRVIPPLFLFIYFDFVCSRKLKIRNWTFKLLTTIYERNDIMDKETKNNLIISVILAILINVTAWTSKLIEWGIIGR